jgi:hypothetical protein
MQAKLAGAFESDRELGLLHVEAADIYGSGHAPTSKHSVIAVEQHWIPQSKCN